MNGRRGQAARGLLLLAGLALLWWTLRTVSVAEIWQTLAQLRPGEIALLAAVNGLILATFCARWWLFLAAQGHRIPILALLGYRLTAFGISYFTPGPHFGGEPWQVYAVSRRHRVPYADSIAAVTLDKLVEMLVNFAFLAGGVLFVVQQGLLWDGLGLDAVQEETPGAENGGLAIQLVAYTLALLAVPLALLAAYRRGRRPLTRGLRTIHAQISRRTRPRPVQPQTRPPVWLATVERSENQVGHLCRHAPKTVAAASLISVVGWGVVVWEFWLVTTMLGLDLRVPQSILALLAARLAILLPVPAALGVLEAGQAMVMSSLGRGPAAGIGVTLLIRARDTLLALAGLWLGGLGVWSLVQGRPPEGAPHRLDAQESNMRGGAPPTNDR